MTLLNFLSNFADMVTCTYIQPDTASVQAFFSSQLKAFAIDIFFRKSWQLSFYCTQATYLACMLMCVCLYLFAKVFLQFHVPSHIMITRRARERERRTHDKYVFRDKGKRSTFRNYFTLERTRKRSFQIPVITQSDSSCETGETWGRIWLEPFGCLVGKFNLNRINPARNFKIASRTICRL